MIVAQAGQFWPLHSEVTYWDARVQAFSQMVVFQRENSVLGIMVFLQ